MNNDLISLEQIQAVIRSNSMLTPEAVFGREEMERWRKFQNGVEEECRKIDAEIAREKERGAAASKPYEPAPKSEPEKPKNDELPDHLDESRNPMLGGKAHRAEAEREKLPPHLDPARNPMIKAGG